MDDRSITPSARGASLPDAHLLALIQFVDEAVVGRSADGVVTMWNAAAEQLFGYSSTEMVGQKTERLFAPENAEESLFKRVSGGEALHNYPARCLTKNGRSITALITVLSSVSTGASGGSGNTGSLIIAVDAVAQNQREDAKHFLAAIVESADDAIMSKTLAGVVTSWNRAAEKMFGYTAEEMIGAPITKIFPPEALPEEVIILERLRRGERIDHYETKRQRKDGRIVDVSLTVSPIRDGQGRLVGASKIARDITFRKQIEAREREALQQAQTLNRAKDEFIATISHELRTPMTAILGWIRMLKLGDLKPEAETKAIAVIERNAKAQARLIEDLLDASRIVSGKLKLNVRRMDLATVIDAVVDALRPACQAKHISVETFVDSGSGVMIGDSERMQQVVWNLMSNAIKFTSKTGRVEVRLAQQDSRIRLTVSDTGAGIAPEFLPYVFNRFSQADSSLTRAHGGLGMGLSIVKSIVELHGGVVAASSEGLEKGATFSVDLPINAISPPEATNRKGTSGSNVVRTELVDLKILVVDDEVDTCEMLRHLLERCGAVVSTATSAAEALLFLQVARVDLLISDISMPTVDGYELIRRVRAGEASQNTKIPAVALTALARIEDRVKVLAAGYQMHIAKPVEPSELVTVVASLGNNRIQ